jgi:hypothetical protein
MSGNPFANSRFITIVAAAAFWCLSLAARSADGAGVNGGANAGLSQVMDGLKVSANGHYLVDEANGKPVFLLADTAWNLGALKLEEIDTYLQSRADHGFNAIMFALNFSPQAEEKNAYGEPAYIGADKTDLNPAYFATCDQIVKHAAARGLYVVLYPMWAGEKAGTMNFYTPAQLELIGRELGSRYGGDPNVIFSAGGEATPHYIDVDRVNAMGRGLKEGCAGRNLVTVHPMSPFSSSDYYASSPWLDFNLIQAKSGVAPANTAFDAAALVLKDWTRKPARPTMMGEHRYESGTQEDPIIQRRSLYQCVFAGACGHVYGHDALWQMTPHTGAKWMLHSWTPGVKVWTDALNAPGVQSLHLITELLYSHPYLERIPDQALVLAGQGADVFSRIEATRDGTVGNRDATYLMAYLSAPAKVTLDTSVIAAQTLKTYWFDPATGATEVIQERFPNPQSLTLEPRTQGHDWVVVIEGASRNYPRPKAD